MAEKKGIMSKVGVWAYIAGLVIAILVALFSSGLGKTTVAILGILGIVVGLLNISDEEVQLFLLGSVAFVIAASSMGAVFGALGLPMLETLAQGITVFTAPGALVVAFKALYNVAKDD